MDSFGWVGATIDGKYDVARVVGEGGFGVVYQGTHRSLGDSVAIKCLKVPGNLGPEARDEFRRNFLEEGRLLRKLSRCSTGIVQALDAGDAVSPQGAWTPYLVLEWLDGQPLDSFLEKRRSSGAAPLSLREAVALLDPAARALATAHAQGVAHRDIKPANIFLASIGGHSTTKILDFGIAKVMTETTSLTRALAATGGSLSAFTPLYGAPEQFNKRFGATGTWTDVHALALVFVELATGRSALDGDDITQLFIAATDASFRPTLRRRGLEVSAGVEAVIERALAVDPKQRTLTAGEFWDALIAALEALPSATIAIAPASIPSQTQPAAVPAAPIRTSQNLGFSPPSSELVPAPPPSVYRKKSRIGLVVAGVLGGLGVVGGGLALGAYLLFHGARIRVESRPDNPRAAVSAAASSAPAAAAVAPEGMIYLPPATFTMGAAGQGKTEVPHKVTLTRGFFIDRLETTVDEYKRCVKAQRCTSTGIHGGQTKPEDLEKYGPYCNEPDPSRGRNPVNCIDRLQAEEYCKFSGKRLPTEAEWEYAARGTDGRLFPWGNASPSCDQGAWDCGQRNPRTEDVGSHPSGAAASGALDMAGNVWEWVADGWDPEAYKRGDRTDPLVPLSGARAILRGGGWDFNRNTVKATFRLPFEKTWGQVSTGVRCAMDAR